MSFHFQISVTTDSSIIEKLSDIFMEMGALAVTLTDAKEEPLFQLTPEHEPLWQHTTLHILFDSQHSPENIIHDIKTRFPEWKSLDFYAEKIQNENWVLKTQKQFQAQQFGKLWVCPQWEKDTWKKKHKRERYAVFIEPGLAFGTGTHPTTQLCLTWLATHALRNKIMIDYGCGSGILALSACALGAKTVWATDHDEQALIATNNNAKCNEFKLSCEFHCVPTDAMQSVRANIIVANILTNTLIDLAPTFISLLQPKGKLILSGILSHDLERVLSCYEKHFKKRDVQMQDEWVLVELWKR